MKLIPVVKRIKLPDPVYIIETVTVGMTVTVRVIKDCGRIEITHEIFTIEKTRPHWLKYIAEFERLANLKYKPGITPYEFVNNKHKQGN